MCLGKQAGHYILALILGMGSGAAMAEVVVIVSSSSPVLELSRNQVADIFLGKTRRFPDGREAMPVDQQEGAAARDEFYARFAVKSPAQIKAHWSKIIFTGRGQPPKEMSDSGEVKRQVAGNPDAIGYIDKTEVDGSVRALMPK